MQRAAQHPRLDFKEGTVVYFVFSSVDTGLEFKGMYPTYESAYLAYRGTPNLIILKEACYCDMGDEPCEDHVEL